MVGYKWVVSWQRVGEEDRAVERVRWRRIDAIGGEDCEYQDERIEPCMSKREAFPPSEHALRFPPFGEARGLLQGTALVGKSVNGSISQLVRKITYRTCRCQRGRVKGRHGLEGRQC